MFENIVITCYVPAEKCLENFLNNLKKNVRHFVVTFQDQGFPLRFCVVCELQSITFPMLYLVKITVSYGFFHSPFYIKWYLIY